MPEWNLIVTFVVKRIKLGPIILGHFVIHFCGRAGERYLPKGLVGDGPVYASPEDTAEFFDPEGLKSIEHFIAPLSGMDWGFLSS